MALASRGSLSDPEVLEQQVKRMLKDQNPISGIKFCRPMALFEEPRCSRPKPALFPDFDDNLRQSMRKEPRCYLKYHF
ncbi:MAG: hypothetical protein Ct9H90mP25_5550 [Gammaproteobacteria bacterium]|nr:MAG: hypothetical protein Ct9H90mP25_5550 [Gammaproteobacteria bacterium]